MPITDQIWNSQIQVLWSTIALKLNKKFTKSILNNIEKLKNYPLYLNIWQIFDIHINTDCLDLHANKFTYQNRWQDFTGNMQI